MKTLVLYIITAICIATLQSCVISNIVDEPDLTVKSGPTVQYGNMAVKIQNSAGNICLQIDSIEICNITVADTSTGRTHKGNITAMQPAGQNQAYTLLPEGTTATSRTITLPYQRFTPWTPNILPGNTNNQYIKIYGRIYTYGNNSTLILLSSSPMYTPLHGKITETQTTEAIITLESDCPIYIEHNGSMTKVLQEITFNVSIEDWEESCHFHADSSTSSRGVSALHPSSRLALEGSAQYCSTSPGRLGAIL